MAGRRVEFDIIANDHASKALGKVGDSADHAGGRLGKLGGLAKGAGFAIGGAAVGGVVAFSAALVQGVKDASSYQDLAARTANVLKTTGNVAGTSVKGVQELAGKLESLSGVDEELIINSQNVLATFTDVRNVGKDKIFDEATKSALDMSVALGTDLQGSTIQLGKALNDPIKGVSALSRVGVSFTQKQKDTIKALVESGDKMGAQKIILGELKKEFGGAAEAAGKGFNGSLARLKDTLGDTFRNLGTKLLPVLTKFANWLNEKAIPAVITFGEKIGPKLAAAWNDKIRPAIGKVWEIGKKLTGWIKGDLNPFIRETVDKVMPIFQFALDNIRGAFKGSQKSGKDWAGALKVAGAVVKTVFAVVIGAVALFAASFSIQLRVTKTIVEKVVIPAIKLLWRVVSTQFGLMLDAMTAAFGWIPGIGPKLKAANKQFKTFVAGVNNSLDNLNDHTISIRVRGQIGPGVKNSKGRNIRADNPGGGAAVGGYRPAGWVGMVGENGPEMVQFAQGGTVSTAGQTARAMAGGGGGVTEIHNHYYQFPGGMVFDSDRAFRRAADQANSRSRRTYVTATGRR